jgi:hypothetical protein
VSLFANAPTQQARWAACNQCHNREVVVLLICKACSCLLISKIAMEGSTCPLGKWPPPEEAALSQD